MSKFTTTGVGVARKPSKTSGKRRQSTTSSKALLLEGKKSSGGYAALRRRRAAYRNLVKSLSDQLGVKIAAIPPAPAKNPYSLNTADATAVLKRAGIVTGTGKLTSRFK